MNFKEGKDPLGEGSEFSQIRLRNRVEFGYGNPYNSLGHPSLSPGIHLSAWASISQPRHPSISPGIHLSAWVVFHQLLSGFFGFLGLDRGNGHREIGADIMEDVLNPLFVKILNDFHGSDCTEQDVARLGKAVAF